tara:strand:- start:3406 stop:3591 length:186 start_codon:yes stop_codon:yes gene_type:complete
MGDKAKIEQILNDMIKQNVSNHKEFWMNYKYKKHQLKKDGYTFHYSDLIDDECIYLATALI